MTANTMQSDFFMFRFPFIPVESQVFHHRLNLIAFQVIDNVFDILPGVNGMFAKAAFGVRVLSQDDVVQHLAMLFHGQFHV
ncbi:hypothetical protein SDC9_168020 [bioreactor metagenome]|uniref:Uncharacterized protein n=1 Tax=bioreactor metagenome TaxID=1076179 RepID=A0A645G1E5_9ZZZZ